MERQDGHGVPREAGPGCVWVGVRSLGAVAPMVEGAFAPMEGLTPPTGGVLG